MIEVETTANPGPSGSGGNFGREYRRNSERRKQHRRRMPKVIVIFGEARLNFRQREDWEAHAL
jgi:hypothetical protein